MRFHHSTRRGRNRLAHQSGGARGAGVSGSRWSQLGYCRETNIHFNRRLPVEPPPATRGPSAATLQDSDSMRLLAAAADSQQQAASINEFFRGDSISSPEARGQSMPPDSRKHALDDLATRGLRHEDNDLELDRLSLRDGRGISCKPQAKSKQHHHSHRHRHKHQEKEQTSCKKKESDDSNPEMSGRLDLESAREKLVAQVEKHPFWSNKAARRMHLTGVKERRIYIYELVSYCERRELEWRYEPYKGGLQRATYKPPDFYYSQQPATAPVAGCSRSTLVPRPASFGLRDPMDRQSSVVSSQSVSPSTIIASPTSEVHQSSARRHREASSLLRRACSSASDSVTTASCDRQKDSSSLEHILASDSPLDAASGATSIIGNHDDRRASSRRTLQLHYAHLTQSSEQQLQQQLNVKQQQLLELRRQKPSSEFVWSIEIPAQLKPEPFVGANHSTELPNSSFVKRCHGCQGRGRLKCNSCYGVGYEVCISCSGKGTTKSLAAALSSRAGSGRGAETLSSAGGRNSTFASGYDMEGDADAGGGAFSSSVSGRGRDEPGGITSSQQSPWVTESCSFCHGAGQKRCWVCAGKSYNYCFGCAGTGQLRCYLNVNVTWINHRDEMTLNNTDSIIPKDRLRLSSGLVLVDRVADRLGPLDCSQLVPPSDSNNTTATSRLHKPPVEESIQLETTSRKLLDRHIQNYHQERLIKQRHRVTQIECHVIEYEWKQRRGHFVIYGDEHKVYIAKYPFKSLCNIT